MSLKKITRNKGHENIGADVSVFCDWQTGAWDSLHQETGESGKHVNREHKLVEDSVRIFRRCTAD